MVTMTAVPGATRSARPSAALVLWLHLTWLDLKRSQGYLAAALIVLMTPLVGLSAGDADGYILWWNVNAGILKSAALVAAPVTAALAAWLIDRDRRRRASELTDATAMPAFRRDLAIVTVASFWGLLGLLGIAIRFIWPAIRVDAWGGPDLLLIAFGCLTVAFGSTLGCVIGRVIQSRYAPILAFVGMFGLTVAAEALFPATTSPSGEYSQSQPFRYLMPWVYGNSLTETGRISTGLILNGCAWMALIAIVAIAILALLRRRSGVTVTSLGIASIAAILAATPLVIQAQSGRSGPYNLSLQPIEFSCQTMQGFDICLHPAYANQAQDQVAAIAEGLEPLAGLPGIPSRVEQGGMWPTETGDSTVLVVNLDSHGFMLPSLYEQLITPPKSQLHDGRRSAAQYVILTWLYERADAPIMPLEMGDGQAPLEVQPISPASENDGAWVPPTYDEAELAEWGLRIDEAVTRFAALDPAAQRAWLEANWTALVAGTLPFEALP